MEAMDFASSASLFVRTSTTRSVLSLERLLDFTVKYLQYFFTVSMINSSESYPFALTIRILGALATGHRSSTKRIIVSQKVRTHHIAAMPSPQMIPVEIAQNKNTRSIGSLMAVLKRTIERAPTIPRDTTMLDCMVSMMAVVMRTSAGSAILKVLE